MKKKFLCLIFLFLSLRNFFSAQQQRIDSLENLLKSAREDTFKIELFNSICGEYTLTGKFKPALESGNKARSLAEKINYKKGIADANNNLGRLFWSQSNYETAPKYYLMAIKFYEEIKDTSGLGGAYNNLGIIYDEQGDYDKGMDCYFKGLKLRELKGDKAGMAGSYTNLGIIYWNQGKLDIALEYYFKGLKIKEELKDKRGISSSYVNIGNLYYDQNDYRLSLEYYHKSKELDSELHNNQGLGYCYINIGNLFSKVHGFSEDTIRKIFPVYDNISLQAMRKKLLDSAEWHQSRAYAISKDLEDAGSMAYCLKTLGDIAFQKNEFSLAIKIYKDAARLTDSLGLMKELTQYYKIISNGYSELSDYKKAFEYHKLYAEMKDSLLNEESNRNAAEMQAKYESEKKDNEIILLNKDKEISEAEGRRKNILIIFIAAGLLLLIIFAGLIFRALRITKKQKKIIELQKNEVSRQKELSEAQKHLVEEHRKEIIDSITYAKRIQNAILVKEEDIKNFFPESFLLYKPKDIVAGDFYWMEYIDNLVFLAAADCTGHGVPGAMVSVVCSNALNRTVKEFGLRDTGKILDKVTDLVLETFEKSGEQIKDGMDISLLRVELHSTNGEGLSAKGRTRLGEGMRFQWSGANNPLWYFAGNRIVEINANKQPVGKFDNRKPFSTHHISCEENPVFFLFTDGYPDQFGGPKGKKFKYKQLEELLLSIHDKPMNEQKEFLNKTIEDWKGNLEQVDDICVIGIRV